MPSYTNNFHIGERAYGHFDNGFRQNLSVELLSGRKGALSNPFLLVESHLCELDYPGAIYIPCKIYLNV